VAFELKLDHSGAVDNFIKKSYFSPRELPQAVLRMVLVREFWLGVGGPMLLLLTAQFLATLAPFAYALAVLWLLWTISSLARIGKRVCIGCWHGDALVAGLSLRVSRQRRRILLEGAMVAPEHRKAGLFVALLAAAFRIARADDQTNPVTIGLWAPAHPASRHVVDTYLGGHTRLPVRDPAFTAGLARLESELADNIAMLPATTSVFAAKR
jgi:GNAT superfamily N-acetyltransferase